MLPSCNPVVGLTFFTSVPACVARGLSAVAQGNDTFDDRPREAAKKNGLTAHEGLTDAFPDVGPFLHSSVFKTSAREDQQSCVGV